MKVKDCMCHEVAYVNPDCSVEECAKLMCNNHVGCIPVCNTNKEVVGLVTDRDILLRTVGCSKDIKQTPVSDIMTCKVCCCTPEADISDAEKIMSENQIRRLPVINDNKIVGILTLGDLAANSEVESTGVCDTLEDICDCSKKNAQ